MTRSMIAEPLETAIIEEAATRPPMLPVLRLPLKIGSLLLCIGGILVVLLSSTEAEIIAVGTDIMICFALRPFVAVDYNGFDILLIWARLDLPCLDTRQWGGTRVSSFPLRPSGYYGMSARAR